MTTAVPIHDAEPTLYTDVTVYLSGSFGWIGTYCRTAKVREGKWAQYNDAIHVSMLEPRKRTFKETVKTDREVVIVRGRGPARPVDPFETSVTPSGTVCRRTKAGYFDPMWDSMFENWIASSGLEIIVDLRRKVDVPIETPVNLQDLVVDL